MKWRKATDDQTHYDGDSYLVALPVMSAKSGNRWYELLVITANVYKDGTLTWNTNEDTWDEDWSAVGYYVPLQEAIDTLPPISEVEFKEPPR